jgi:uncharacterized protein (TIGR01370 family)
VLDEARSDHDARLAALARARRWAPAFGSDRPPVGIGDYELAVIDGLGSRDAGSRPSRTLVATLSERTLLLAYLSVGSVEEWRPHTAQVPREWSLGPVPDRPGEHYVDVRERGWRALLTVQARQLADAGFDGLFLGRLDVADVHPEVVDAVVGAVGALRAAVPQLLLVAHNGLAVADRLAVDAIAQEDVFARWDGSYRRPSRTMTERILARLRCLRRRGLPVFTLDYAQPGSCLAAETVRRAVAEGFRPAVSVATLDRLPHATADPLDEAA